MGTGTATNPFPESRHGAPRGLVWPGISKHKKTKKIKLQHYHCLLIKLVQEATKGEGLSFGSQLPRK